MKARIIAISGGTGSGKSSFAQQAPDSLVLSTDDFYHDLCRQTRQPDGTIYWEDPITTDLNACATACTALAKGQAVDIPVYDMLTDSRVGYKHIQPKAGSPVVVEGIFAFEPQLASIADLLIFLDINWEIRKNRRLQRDMSWGFSSDDVLRYLHDTEIAERDRLPRYRKLAHVVLNENSLETYWQNY